MVHKWGSDDRNDQDRAGASAHPIVASPHTDVPDRYSSMDADEDLVIYDSENHQAWIESSVGLRLSECR